MRLFGDVRPDDPIASPGTPIEARFWRKVEKTSGCWNWMGAKNDKGYGFIKLDGCNKLVRAHRFAFELLVGPIPEGLQLDHTCRNKSCVNPAHLEPVTNEENSRRRWEASSGGLVDVAGTLGGSSQSGGFRTTDLDQTGAFIPEIAYALQERDSKGSDSKGSDSNTKSGHLIPVVCPGLSAIPIHQPDASDRDSSRDGCGIGKPGDPMFSLRDRPRDAVAAPIAYTLHGADKTVSTTTQTDIAGSVRTKPPGSIENSSTTVVMQAVAFNARQDPDSWHERTGPLDTDGTTQAVAFHENQRGEVTVNDTVGALKNGGGKPGQGYPAVAFTERTRADGRNFECQEEVAYALTNPGSGGRTHSRQIAQGYAVRRLTPRECNRLQGFPDDWDLVTNSRGKPMADGPRYKMMGNAVTVSTVQWIARRIHAFLTTRSSKQSENS